MHRLMDFFLADQTTKLTCHLKLDVPANDNPELAVPIRKVRVSLSQSPDLKTGHPAATREEVFLDPINSDDAGSNPALLPGEKRFGKMFLGLSQSTAMTLA